MKSLTDLCEGILDNDFDINLTLGDVYDFLPHFGSKEFNNMRPPSDYNGYDWKSAEFWAKYDDVKNSWTERMSKKAPARLKFLKRDIRHGFAMWALMQPADTRIDQRFADECAKHMNRLCDGSKLRLKVRVSGDRDAYAFTMWNTKIRDSVKGYIGAFEIVRK